MEVTTCFSDGGSSVYEPRANSKQRFDNREDEEDKMTHYRDEKLTIKQENGYPYKESVSSPSPTKKHVIYVEVMPASFLKLERSNNDDGCDNDVEDPLMTCSVSYLKTHRKKKSRQLDWESDKKQKRLKCNDAENLIGENCEIKIKQEQEEPDDERNSISPSRDDYSHVYSPRQNLSSFNIEFKKKKKKHRKASMEFAVLLRCNRTNCDYTTKEPTTLNEHKKTQHRGQRDFQCDQCIYSGATASDLRKHYRQHTGEIPYVCKIIGCNFRARHNNSLNYHTRKYHPTGEPMKCDATMDCIFTTYITAALKHHKMMAHGGGKTLACEQCPYKCYLMADLRKHLRVHTGENPYVCDFEGCRYACKISSNLKKHKRIHTEEKPYICDTCEFRTNFINSLKVHKRTHTNERPYCCDQCGYRCNHTSNLKKHVIRLHPGVPYNIVKCDNATSAESQQCEEAK